MGRNRKKGGVGSVQAIIYNLEDTDDVNEAMTDVLNPNNLVFSAVGELRGNRNRLLERILGSVRSLRERGLLIDTRATQQNLVKIIKNRRQLPYAKKVDEKRDAVITAAKKLRQKPEDSALRSAFVTALQEHDDALNQYRAVSYSKSPKQDKRDLRAVKKRITDVDVRIIRRELTGVKEIMTALTDGLL